MIQDGSRFIEMVRSLLLLVLLPAVLFGCLTVHPPADVIYTSGAVVESLSSNASLAHTTSDRSISGSGYIMYRKPDQMRAVILSPFGSVLQEIYISGDLVTIIDSGNGIAFSGTFSDLPDKGDFNGWRYIHWLIDIDPPDSVRGNSSVKRINRFGESEEAVFENGLLVSKTTAAGSHASYGRYSAVKGVAFPLEIKCETVDKETFTILLDDPEINVPFADGVFTPSLSKLRVYPLSGLK